MPTVLRETELGGTIGCMLGKTVQFEMGFGENEGYLPKIGKTALGEMGPNRTNLDPMRFEQPKNRGLFETRTTYQFKL